ncbi:MAG: hypothetical protein ACREV6_23695 [Clostridium sp.]
MKLFMKNKKNNSNNEKKEKQLENNPVTMNGDNDRSKPVRGLK